MLSALMNLLKACWQPSSDQHIHAGSDAVGRQDGLLWYKDAGQHLTGEFSMAVVQANNLLEDQSQIESGPLSTIESGPHGTFVGVYDGHGGPETSRYINEHLFHHLKRFTSEQNSMSADVIRKAYQATEEGFFSLVTKQWPTKPQIASVGSCCLTGVICGSTLYVANVGDSRAVLGRLVKATGEVLAVQLSAEHNASFESVRQELFSLHPDDPQIVVLNLDGMLTNRDMALNVLEGMTGGSTKTDLAQMLLQGYGPNEEPYLSMMLKAHREYQLSEIRSKCRVFVPKGRVLMGCLDEKGVLDYGQVCIHVTLTRSELEDMGQSYFQRTSAKTSVVVGKVIVTKNPCLHPGDIRVLQAVYNPELEDTGLIDCVIFPQKGARPHPNECSGGDLDGDLYFVCWDENLIPSKTDTPMDYIARKPRLMDHEVTLEEIQRFFVDYMISDTLGTISTAHLVLADREPTKGRSFKCLQLAKLHSMAVDFAKTGAPAEMPRILKPREYPDFLERTDRPMYTSPGILGKLYRATINHRKEQKTELIWSETVARAAYDEDLVVSNFEAFIVAAENYKSLYAEKLGALMNFYGAECEDEILTGNLRKRSTYLQRDNRKYGEMKDRILAAARSLQEEAKAWFKSGCEIHERSRMASAWYHVTYHPDYSSGTHFLSFPWVLSDVLLNIKSSRKREKLNTNTCLGGKQI